MIYENSRITQKQAADSLGLTVRAVKMSMKQMVEKGVIKREEPTRGGHWKVN